MAGRLSVVVGGQFGSEAKGHLVADLAMHSHHPSLHVVRVAGPNAGHSAVGFFDGITWALRQIPVAAVTRTDATLWIAAGSEIDVPVLLKEITALDGAGYNVSGRLFIDRSATLLTPDHVAAETEASLTGRLGSTGKGVGAARSARIMRTAAIAGDAPELARWVREDPTADLLGKQLDAGGHVIIEGTQGYGLGLHTGFYPKVTSSDCRAIDFLAMVGLSPWRWADLQVWVVVRPYPIRVAGNSGPLLDETSWEQLGLPVEMTTVTKKVRRVGGWDPSLVRDAVRANGGHVKLAFSMADQVVPSIAGAAGPYHYDDNTDLDEWIARVESAAGDDSLVEWIGTGPGTSLQVELGTDALPSPNVALSEELTTWWLDLARHEVAAVVPKAVAYGATDLRDIGRDLAECMGRQVDDEEAAELGVYFYLRGKVSRWTNAIIRGDRVADDTLHDTGVYVRMAQRIRSHGGWPNAK